MNAILSVKKVQACVSKDFHLQLPASESTVLDEADATEKKQIVAREKMQLCMSYLTLAMDSNVVTKMVEKSKSTEWPSGRPDLLMAKLDKKYKPSDSVAVAEQSKALFDLKLHNNQDPDELGDKIAELETSFGCELAEKEKVAAIMKAAPGGYADVILQETKRAGNAGEDVEADNLIEVMSERFRLTHGGEKLSGGDDGERAQEVRLASTSGTFPGKCNRCHQNTGFKAADCPCKEKNGGIVCRLCNVKGHIERNCWEDEKNANRRPKNWVSRLNKESEAAGADIEICLNSISFDTDMNAVLDGRTDMNAVLVGRTEYAVLDGRTEYNAVLDGRTDTDAIRDVCTDYAVHDGRTDDAVLDGRTDDAVRDERTENADRDDRTEEMMKNAVHDGRTEKEKSAHDVYDVVGTDGTIFESVESMKGDTTETAFVMNYDGIKSDTDDDEKTFDFGGYCAKTSTMNSEQGGVLDGDILGARKFTGMSSGGTNGQESNVSSAELEDKSHDDETVTNSVIRI